MAFNRKKNMILKARTTAGGDLRLLIPYPRARRKRVKIVIGKWKKEFKKAAKKSDILILSEPRDLKRSWREEAFLIKGPGEYEVKGIFVTGILDSGPAPLYLIQGEGTRSLYLHSFGEKELKRETWERVGEVDVMFTPLRKKSLPRAKKMRKIISQVEPKVTVFFRQEDEVGAFLEKADISFEEREEVKLEESHLEEEKPLYFLLGGKE